MNLNQLAKQEKSASPVQSQPERDLDNYRELQTLAIQKLEQQMKKQVSGGAGRKQPPHAAEASLASVEWFPFAGRRTRNGSRGCRTSRPNTSRKRTRCVPCRDVKSDGVESTGWLKPPPPVPVPLGQLLNELSNMQTSVSEQQDGNRRLQQEMRRQLQEKEQTIRAQREQVGTRSRPQREEEVGRRGQPPFRISWIGRVRSDCARALT